MVVTKRNETVVNGVYDDNINLVRTKTASTYNEFIGERNTVNGETLDEAVKVLNNAYSNIEITVKPL